MLDGTLNLNFDYEKAFERNIGWLTKKEQSLLQSRCIGIAGMGGVGGAYLLSLARLGVTKFKIADFDNFELANINRQVGANIETMGQAKVQTLAHYAKQINPNISIEQFEQGITPENVSAFLSGLDLYLDGIDFFELKTRSLLFAGCHDLRLPAITAAPLGMGCAYLIFMPGKMSFEQYFCLQSKSEQDQLLSFLLGLSPKARHNEYLVDKSTIDLKNHKGPSTFMACQLCAGIVGTESLKILLNRGKVYAAPFYHLFDAYQQKYIRKKLLFGNRNPLQKLKLYWTKRNLSL